MSDQKITVDEILALKEQGLSQSEIAELRGVSRQLVSYHIAQAGKTRAPRIPDFPFKVPTSLQHEMFKRLRDHAEYMASNGNVPHYSERRIRELLHWQNRLREKNEVVEYDPNIPPGLRDKRDLGGWAYRPREPKDGDLIIRVNKYTNLTEKARRIFVLPSVP